MNKLIFAVIIIVIVVGIGIAYYAFSQYSSYNEAINQDIDYSAISMSCHSYVSGEDIRICDNNVLFLRGQCEKTNNAFHFCSNPDIDSYIEERGIGDTPTPKAAAV